MGFPYSPRFVDPHSFTPSFASAKMWSNPSYFDQHAHSSLTTSLRDSTSSSFYMSQANVPVPLQALNNELRDALTDRIDRLLLTIIKANSGTQYASEAPCLAAFRDAMSSRGPEDDAMLLRDFRDQVPITDYDSYKSWMTRFNERPCKQSRVENLFAPGFPFCIAISSSTSGKEAKSFAIYRHESHENPPLRQHFDFSDAQGPTDWMYYYGYRDVIEVERETGQVLKTIPVCWGSGGKLRLRFGWNVESDEARMSTILPGQVTPWAANMILNIRAFLMIHALFCLACRDLDQISTTFATYFVDLVRNVEENWDMFITSIRDGTIPQLDGIAHLRDHLQATFQSNPERAEELSKIGPPFSCEGWAARVWPRFRRLAGICSGSFATCLPQVRSILGPRIAIRSPRFACTESLMAVCYDTEDTNSFVFESEDVIEFIPTDAELIPSNIQQAWDLEAGKQYQILLTTRNGLWRYHLDDVIEIMGFSPDNGSPVFKYSGRKTSCIRLTCTVISEPELVAAIRKISTKDLIQVHDFTAVVDHRAAPATVGYFVELAGPPGPNAHTAIQKLRDALGELNAEFYLGVETVETRLPTIRVVKPGTFMEYRQWRCERMSVGLAQVKVPVVLSQADAQEWILERVIREL